MSKIIRIPYSNLPDFNLSTKEYQVRYRLKSDDGAKISAFSPIYSINPEFIYQTSSSVVVEKHSTYILATWNPVDIKKNNNVVGELDKFDVWVRWGTDHADGTWQYNGRIYSPSVTLIKPSTPSGIDYFSIEIYVPGKPILRKAIYDVDQSVSAGKINLTTDVITLPTNIFETGYKILYTSSIAIGGLTSGNYYYARMLTSTTMTLHPTENDAINNTNKINLSSNQNTLGYFSWNECAACDFLLYSLYNFTPV